MDFKNIEKKVCKLAETLNQFIINHSLVFQRNEIKQRINWRKSLKTVISKSYLPMLTPFG